MWALQVSRGAKEVLVISLVGPGFRQPAWIYRVLQGMMKVLGGATGDEVQGYVIAFGQNPDERIRPEVVERWLDEGLFDDEAKWRELNLDILPVSELADRPA